MLQMIGKPLGNCTTSQFPCLPTVAPSRRASVCRSGWRAPLTRICHPSPPPQTHTVARSASRCPWKSSLPPVYTAKGPLSLCFIPPPPQASWFGPFKHVILQRGLLLPDPDGGEAKCAALGPSDGQKGHRGQCSSRRGQLVCPASPVLHDGRVT